MCDVSYDWESVASRAVITRKPHTCDCCDRSWPAGSRMRRIFGKWQGEPQTSWACAVCDFAVEQEGLNEELHFCWHDPINWPDEDKQYLYDYIKAELAAGRTPTVEGAEAAGAAHFAEEEA